MKHCQLCHNSLSKAGSWQEGGVFVKLFELQSHSSPLTHSLPSAIHFFLPYLIPISALFLQLFGANPCEGLRLFACLRRATPRMAVLAPAILLLSIATVIIILVSVFTKSLGGYGANILWSYHPFFMTIGFVLLMTMGLISYVSDFGAKVSGLPTAPCRQRRGVALLSDDQRLLSSDTPHCAERAFANSSGDGGTLGLLQPFHVVKITFALRHGPVCSLERSRQGRHLG